MKLIQNHSRIFFDQENAYSTNYLLIIKHAHKKHMQKTIKSNACLSY